MGHATDIFAMFATNIATNNKSHPRLLIPRSGPFSMQKVEKLLGAIPQTPLGDSTPYCSTPAPWIFIRRFDVGRQRPPAAAHGFFGCW